MIKNQKEYAINELAKKANVSVRTIRFYINEGLLPTPQTRGRYTVYNDEYLDRLELILRLKESFLPLKEIRATLTSLSWDEVRASLADLRARKAEDRPGMDEQPVERKGVISEKRSGALDYISDLLSSKPINRPLPPRPAAPSAEPKIAPPSGPVPEVWQRIRLTAGVEIHISQPARLEDQWKIDAIIQLAKKLFKT